MKHLIKDLTPQDETHVLQAARLLYNEFEHAWNSLESAIQEVKECIGEGRIARVMIDQTGQVIGFIAGNSQYDGNVWEMHPLVVSRQVQGTGLGSLLVKDFEEIVEQQGGVTIRLGTDDESHATSLSNTNLYTGLYEKIQHIKNFKRHPFEFYQKCGYQIVGVIPDANGIGKPDILMAKRV